LAVAILLKTLATIEIKRYSEFGVVTAPKTEASPLLLDGYGLALAPPKTKETNSL
jgi:hypothetical protein